MKRSFGRRINEWLHEEPGAIFRHGKWRFWFPTLVGLTALNAVMTAVIFGSDGMQKYIGSIVVLAGAVLCWLALGLLHYSDSEDRILAIGVAVLDSITLLFVAAHFSFLLWCQGHLWTLRAAEDQYRADLSTYNSQWQPVKESNERIASTVERIAGVEKETERLRNDTAYWSRRNKIGPSQSGIKFEAQLSKIEVPPPPKAPGESSAAFLSHWDWWIRVAGFGELALSIVTLIFVRTRTAMINTRSADEFPRELEVENRAPVKREKFSPKKDIMKTYMSFDFDRAEAGLKTLRAALKDISFRLAGVSFKADVNPGLKECRKSGAAPDHIWIRAMKANRGTQETLHSVKARLDILTDATTMERGAFIERLTKFLRSNGFLI